MTEVDHCLSLTGDSYLSSKGYLSKMEYKVVKYEDAYSANFEEFCQ